MALEITNIDGSVLQKKIRAKLGLPAGNGGPYRLDFCMTQTSRRKSTLAGKSPLNA